MKRKFRTRILTVLLAATVMFTSMPMDSYAATINYHQWLDTAKKVALELGKAKFKFDRYGCPKGSFSKAKKLSNSRRVCNCSDYVSWSLVRLGLIKDGKRFYCKGKSVKGSAASTIKGKNFTIIKISGAPRASTLVKKGILKPGDLVSQADGSGHHMQIYAGKNSKGKNLWYAIGKKYQVVHGYINGSRILKTHNDKRAHHNNPRVAMIIRIKGIQWVDYFKITTSVVGGTITKSPKVYWNKSKTIYYKPKAHYHISSIYVDGKKVSITKYPTKYTFKNVKKVHKIKVNFAIDKFDVSATALDQDGNEAGVITGAGKIAYGSAATVEATPNAGYKVDKVLLGGEDVTESAVFEDGKVSYTIDSVTKAANIQFVMVVDEDYVPPVEDEGTTPDDGTTPEDGTAPEDGVAPEDQSGQTDMAPEGNDGSGDEAPEAPEAGGSEAPETV